jgi:hypothetical protein
MADARLAFWNQRLIWTQPAISHPPSNKEQDSSSFCYIEAILLLEDPPMRGFAL